MEIKIIAGIKSAKEMMVTHQDTAASYGSGLVDVFGTPAMITLMEETSQRGVGRYLPDGYVTVGTEVNIKHLKATPVGKEVRCEAILDKVEGRKLLFTVNVWDDQGLIGTGLHTRYIVNVAKFMENL